ncbi:MAG: cytochrome c maturation protein CcmE [Chitinophagaceae bacterium]|nr:cytochrome c maturation protein CcmE [Chitinophagaceae bacterium]
MKTLHIILLVFIAGSIAVLLSFMKSTSTYDSVATAKQKPGKFVHLMAQLDRDEPVIFDPIKNPNYLEFTVTDTSNQKVRVVYHHPKPENFDFSEKLVLKGKYKNGIFECKEIQTKCPSKYKEEQAKGMKHPDSIKIN